MDDKQCEIMTSFEDVFGCGSPMRGKKKKQKTKKTGEQELVFMYVCGGAFQQKKKEGKISQREPDLCVCVCVCVCVCAFVDRGHIRQLSPVCVSLYLAATVCV